MKYPKVNTFLFKGFSLLSVIRGYNILILIAAQYLAAIFIFSPQKSLRAVLLDLHLLFIILASVCVIASGYIINNFYDTKADLINRPIKSGLDSYVSQQTKLKIYFLLNFLGFIFGLLVSWKAAIFFSLYIFAIWFYSHKLKAHPFLGLLLATTLTILPFFAVFIYFKNFSSIIFVHALFLFLVIMVRELIKDLENLKGALVNNYNTFPIKYGEQKTKQVSILLIILTLFPIIILFSYPAIGYMKYYFYCAMVTLIFVAIYLVKSNSKKHYILLHNVLKLLLVIGIFSLTLIEPSLLVDKVIDKLI